MSKVGESHQHSEARRQKDAEVTAELAAQRAEMAGSESVADLVQQLRRRGRIAARRAKVLFGLLIFVIAAGLAFYLGLPFWQLFVDGRRVTLIEQSELLDAQVLRVDRDISEQRESLSAVLEKVLAHQPLPLRDGGAWHATIELDDGRTLFAGTSGQIQTISDIGFLWESAVRPPPPPVAIPSPSQEPIEANLYAAAQLDDGRVVLVGAGNSIVFYDPGTSNRGGQDTAIIHPTFASEDTVYRDVVDLGNNRLLIVGSKNTLLVFEALEAEYPESIQDPPAASNVTYYDATLLHDGRVLIVGSQNTILLYDPQSTEPLVAIESEVTRPDQTHLASAQLDDGRVLIVGRDYSIVMMDLRGRRATFEQVTNIDSSNATLFEAIRLSDGNILILGDFTPAILFNADDEQPLSPLSPAMGSSFGLCFNCYYTAAELRNGDIVLAGNGNEIALTTGRFEPPEEAAATELIGIIDNVVRIDEANRDTTEPIRSSLLALAAIRDDLEERQRSVQQQRQRIDRFPNSLLLDEEQRNFAEFMAACRNVAAASGLDPSVPEPLALACVQGWQAQMELDRDDLWQSLAQQVPPGILLLFLLATLGGLYRYNMRLAGFHHSRADALEAARIGLTETEYEKVIQLSDALAADKVEFGKSNSPSDQAVDMFKAFVARTEK